MRAFCVVYVLFLQGALCLVSAEASQTSSRNLLLEYLTSKRIWCSSFHYVPPGGVLAVQAATVASTLTPRQGAISSIWLQSTTLKTCGEASVYSYRSRHSPSPLSYIPTCHNTNKASRRYSFFLHVLSNLMLLMAESSIPTA